MSKLTHANVANYLNAIRLNFVGSYKTQDEAQEAILVQTWYNSLCEYPSELVDKAVNNVLRKAKSVPYIGHIYEECEALLTANLPSAAELWGKVEKALEATACNMFYLDFPANATGAWQDIRSDFANLPEEARLYFGSLRSFMKIAIDKDGWKYEKGRFLGAVGDIRARLVKTPDYRAKLIDTAGNGVLRLCV